MKKSTKGAIAAGAAALLLAGGAGTMAAWSDSASLEGGKVTAGHLRFASVTDSGTWVWGDGSGSDAFNPNEDFIVPGDKVTYMGSYKMEIKGNNLEAKVTVEPGAGTTGDLEPFLNVTPAGTSLTGLNQDDDGRVIEAGATIEFDPETMNQDGADQTASLAGISIVLEQTAPAFNTP